MSTFKLNLSKIKKSIALAILYVKGDYYLNEYISALKQALEMALPNQSHADLDMNDET